VRSTESPQYPKAQVSTHVFEAARNFGVLHLVQTLAEPEQAAHGAMQLLHFLSLESDQVPSGQLAPQDVPLKNVVPEHSVQVVAEVEHLTQGRSQVLQE
jgi:hypothetical protein